MPRSKAAEDGTGSGVNYLRYFLNTPHPVLAGLVVCQQCHREALPTRGDLTSGVSCLPLPEGDPSLHPAPAPPSQQARPDFCRARSGFKALFLSSHVVGGNIVVETMPLQIPLARRGET